LYKLVEEKDGGPSWIQMMDRSTSTMSYQAWRRDPEVASYPFISVLFLCFIALMVLFAVVLVEGAAAVPKSNDF